MRQYHISRERYNALAAEHEEITNQQRMKADITGTVLDTEDYATCTVIYGTNIDSIEVIDVHDLMYYLNELGYDSINCTPGDDTWNPENVVIDDDEYIVESDEEDE